MKVLIASPWGERLGGSENVLWTLLRHIDRERIDPIVMLLAEGPFGEEIADAGFRTVIHPTHRLRKGGRWIRTTRAVRELIVRERPDVLVGWGPKPQLYLSPAASSTGLLARLVWMVHELPAHVVHRAAIGLPAAGIVCPSQFVAAAVGRLRPHRRTVVIHPGIETAPPASQAETMRLRRELALPEGRTILGMVARLAPIKGQHRLLEALADVRGRGHDCHALLVGGNAHDLAPGYERHLRALCARLRIEDAVTFAGQVADAGPY
ncbi:MAG: hypothetical protein QOF43_2417 [Gaiellaceae bacterium]|nr:hypothetical protein [Gaiellaceae bacterium]